MSSSDSTPKLCVKNCGFYGSPANHNLCSRCYLDFFKQQLLPSEFNGTSSANQVSLHNDENENENENENKNENDHDHVGDDISMAKNKSSRCVSCKKKIGLLGFSCRCGGKYCSMHRYAEEHSCTYDYKAAGRVALARENPLVIHDKLGERV